MFNLIGLLLTAGLLVNLLILSLRYFRDLKLGFSRWLFLHACVPVSFFYLLGAAGYFLFDQKALLYASILPVYFFGFWGALFLSWRQPLRHAGHLVMLASVFWAIWLMVRTQTYQLATRSFLLGLPAASLFIGFQIIYSLKHPQKIKNAKIFD